MKRFVALACLTAFALALSACGSRVNQKNYDKITTDMTYEQVVGILGKPTETSSMDLGVFSGGNASWKDEHAVIAIQFVNGKVLAKTFNQSPGKVK